MSNLEDRLLRIIELRKGGLKDDAIAAELGINEGVVRIYEESVKKTIEGLVNRGVYGLGNVSAEAGLSLVALKMFSKQYGIVIPEKAEREQQKRRYNKEEKRDKIRKAVEEGGFSLEDISQRTGVDRFSVYRFVREFGSIKERRISTIRKAINEGVKSLEELCRRAGVKNPQSIWKYCEEYGIKMPDDLEPFRYRPEIDELIDRGLSLADIGKEFGIGKEAVRQYIEYSGQYEFFRRKREETKEKKRKEKINEKNIFRSIHGFVEARARQLAKEQGWAYEMAVEYYLTHPFKIRYRTPFEKLVKLFELYEKARKKGEKVILRELADYAGFNFPFYPRQILRKVGLAPIHRENKIRKREKMAATRRGFELPLPAVDVGYFLGLDNISTIRNRFQRIGERPEYETINIFVSLQTYNRKLTYKLVSEIYEAKDCGFKRKEIAELVSRSEEYVDRALEERNVYEPFLIDCLRELYNDKSVKTPYVTSEMRKKPDKEG